MSLRQLILSENAKLEFVKNPKTGKIFFVCGRKRGYVSPNALAIMDTGNIDDFQYAECSVNDGPAVPVLMVIGHSQQNIKRTLGAELLY